MACLVFVFMSLFYWSVSLFKGKPTFYIRLCISGSVHFNMSLATVQEVNMLQPKWIKAEIADYLHFSMDHQGFH